MDGNWREVQEEMGAYQVKYIELRLKELSHTAALNLVQSLLGPLSPAQRDTFLAWARAHEGRLGAEAVAGLATAPAPAP